METVMTTAYQLAGPETRTGTLAAWRIAMGVNAVVAGIALAIKFADAATTADPRFTTVIGRVAHELCYFTIESNVIVFLVCAGLALRPDRWGWLAGAPRLAGLVCITITGVVYYALLAADQHYVGIAVVGDLLAHLVSPLLFVGTWLVLGPRRQLDRSHVARMMAFPSMWIALTLARGAIMSTRTTSSMSAPTDTWRCSSPSRCSARRRRRWPPSRCASTGDCRRATRWCRRPPARLVAT